MLLNYTVARAAPQEVPALVLLPSVVAAQKRHILVQERQGRSW